MSKKVRGETYYIMKKEKVYIEIKDVLSEAQKELILNLQCKITEIELPYRAMMEPLPYRVHKQVEDLYKGIANLISLSKRELIIHGIDTEEMLEYNGLSAMEMLDKLRKKHPDYEVKFSELELT